MNRHSSEYIELFIVTDINQTYTMIIFRYGIITNVINYDTRFLHRPMCTEKRRVTCIKASKNKRATGYPMYN